MSGAPPIQYPIVEAFGAGAVAPTDITLPIPVPDQTGTLVGAASFETGFPPATRADPETEGGIPPFGEDMNGILYMLSQYCALAQAGEQATFNPAAATAFEGYKLGAKLASVTTPGRVWVNVLDGNTANPDVDQTGWASEDPLYATIAPAAGQLDNLALPGASDYALDVDTSAGNVLITGLIAQRNGQKAHISNTGANLLQFAPSDAASDPENQFRLPEPDPLTSVQYQTVTLQWFSGLNRWLLV